MDKFNQQNWFHIPWEDAVRFFETNVQTGLSEHEAKKRQKIFGKNILPEEKTPSRIHVFLIQLKSPLIFILVLAGIVTLFLRDFTDSIVIWGAVFLNAFVGYVQEYQATKALAELKRALKMKAKVLRDGLKREIPQEELVPGDIILLNPSNNVSADGRFIETWNLRVQEAALTGEGIASDKTAKTLEGELALADKRNMAFMGTIVQEGEGKAVVTSTGVYTEIGKVATLIQGIHHGQTPYQMRLAKFSSIIGRIIALIAILIFVEGIVAGKTFSTMFTISIAIAVGAIPEGLPVAITATLALGMRRMLKEGGLMRNLASAETLGSTSVIATDKTLTLTEGTMEVEEIFTLRPASKDHALAIGALATEAFVENPEAMFGKWIVRGSPTEKALLMAAMNAGIPKNELEKGMKLVGRIPFESEKKYAAAFYAAKSEVIAYILGAPEILLSFATELPSEKVLEIKTKLSANAARGLRVVAIAEKRFPVEFFPFSDHKKTSLKGADFFALVMLKDPIRKGVKEAIQTAKNAGIETIIVTGDHVLTAAAIGKELGIDGMPNEFIEGKDFEKLSDTELQRRLHELKIYARVEPAHKLRIVEAFQKAGKIIAMTGDGINDAPALKKANIGIALGSGTDVAKESADLVLLGDKFSIIPAAIKEGRTIMDNIRKIITYLLSGSFSEMILIGTSLLFGLPLPVTAAQILWVNLVEDGLPGIALTFEKAEKDTMLRKPEGARAALLTPEMKVIIFAISILTDIMLFGLFLFLLSAGYQLEEIRTVMFVGLAMNSLLYVFSCRDLHQNIWQYNPFSNLLLTGGVLISFTLLLAPIYLPFLQTIFNTVALSWNDWKMLISLSLINIALIEATKWFFIKRSNYAAIDKI